MSFLMTSEAAALRMTDADEVTGQELCDEARSDFVRGLLLCSTEAEARDELKLLLVDAMTVVHKSPLEGVLSRAYDEVVDATDSGHKLRG